MYNWLIDLPWGFILISMKVMTCLKRRLTVTVTGLSTTSQRTWDGGTWWACLTPRFSTLKGRRGFLVVDMAGKICQKHFINHNKSMISIPNLSNLEIQILLFELIDFADVFLFPHQEDSALVADIIPVSIGREMAVKVGDRLEAGRHLLEWHALETYIRPWGIPKIPESFKEFSMCLVYDGYLKLCNGILSKVGFLAGIRWCTFTDESQCNSEFLAMSFNCFMAMKLSCAPVCRIAYRPYQFWERLPLDLLVCFFVNRYPSNTIPATIGEMFLTMQASHSGKWNTTFTLKNFAFSRFSNSLLFGKLTWTQRIPKEHVSFKTQSNFPIRVD